MAVASAFAAGMMLLGGAGCGDSTECGVGTTEVDGTCVPDSDACGDGTTFNPSTGKCDANCAPGTTLVEGQCVPDGSVVCGVGTTFNTETGECDPDVSGCGEGLVLDDNGACVDPTSLWDPDVTEPAEPNGFEGTPGTFTLPEVGESTTLGGCIVPADLDSDGRVDTDFDVFLFQATDDVVLDIKVEGAGGLSGGFLLVSAEDELVANDWQRLGLNLVDETAQREVYVPIAGTYALAVSDGRSVLSGEAAGNPEACYQVTVQVKGVPTPTPMTGTFQAGTLGGVQLFSFDPNEGDILFNEIAATGPAVLSDAVQLVNGAYRGSAPGPGQRDLGTVGNLFIDGLADDDEVVFVVDPVLNFSLDEEPFTLSVTAPGADALPADDTLTITNDGFLFRWVYFDATAGDILQMDMTTTSDAVLLGLFGPGLSLVSDICPQGAFGGGGCDSLGDTFVQLPVTGRYYVRLFDFTDPQPATFDISFSHELVQPATLDTVTAAALGARGVDWYELDVTASNWASFLGSTTDFDGNIELSFYDRTAVGEVDADFSSLDNLELDGTDSERKYAGLTSTFLVRVGDAGIATGTGVYDLSVAETAFTDLGTIAPATAIDRDGDTVTTGARERYLVTGAPGDFVTVTVTGTAGFDPLVEVIDQFGVFDTIDTTGVDEAETATTVFGIGSAGFLAFAVVNETGADGTFDIDVVAQTPDSTTSAPALAIPDNNPAGTSDTLTVAGACTITNVAIDVDISHTFIGDLIISVTSPTGTEVLLHDESGGGADDIVGTYPVTLVPAEDLSVLIGEEGMGDWTLSLEDTFSGDAGTLNSWTVNLFCE